MDRGHDTAASRPNGRALPSQLHVDHEGRRPLFASNVPRSLGNEVQSATASVGTGARPGGLGAGVAAGSRFTRRAKSDPEGTATGFQKGQRNDDPNASSASLASPGGSRIPRPNISALQNRRPISLAQAFKLAQEEEEDAERERKQGGSPSPAPRPWRARPGQPQDETEARKMMAEDPLDSRSRARQSAEARVMNAQSPNAKSRPTEPTTDASKRISNGPSLQDRINEWRTKSRPTSDWADTSPERLRDASGDAQLPDLVPGIEDVPFQSVESPGQHFGITSPSKDFTWQVDQDFTAGDLQVSDSPRIKVGNNSNKPFANRPSILDRIDIRSSARVQSPGSRNNKLEEIRARELNHDGENLAGQSQLTPRRYTKLEEIRAREAAAEKQIPIPDRNLPRPKNTKLDEIRQREAEGLSRRAMAAARLEEIKEKNAMSRSLSPEKGRSQASRQKAPETRLPARSKSDFEVGGQKIPDTPVTVFKSYRPKQENINPNEAGTSRGKDVAAVKPDVNERDLLRRLARAASSSPAPEPVNRRAPLREKQQAKESEMTVTKPVSAGRSAINGRKSAFNSRNKATDSSRPTVGFAGLKRIPSAESAMTNASSLHSEGDPTARIEAEAKLFALNDNSEPGSVRAPSPEPDSDEEDDGAVEDTPRPQKHDFLVMETPRVTGAYVETPVTVKVERVKEEEVEDIKPFKEKLKDQRERSSKPDAPAPAMFRDKKTSLAWRNKAEDTASEPGAKAENGGDSMAASGPGRRTRSRSLPRGRPPLKNSAKPPSVKDDLRELQRQHNMDDSTMDDLEDILAGRKHASPELKKALEGLTVTREDCVPDELEDVEKEIQNMKQEGPEEKDLSAGTIALYDRMNKTLRTGLSSLRTAKLGIQRLEDQVAQAEKQPFADEDELKPTKTRKHQHTKKGKKVSHDEQCPDCIATAEPVSVAYLHLPIPQLYYTTPQFRLSIWGSLLALAALWYAAESAVCGQYCRPAACTSIPCVYSYDDPTFGNALPVKLDQWTTGGYGRQLVTWVYEELQDWAADIDDALQGRSLTDISVDRLSVEEKRQHRRRLTKRGLISTPATTNSQTDQTAKWDAWRRSRQAKEQSKSTREMDYDISDGWIDDALGGDERIW